MNEDLLLFPLKSENARIVTSQGEMMRAASHKPQDVYDNADALQALMIKTMKDPKARKGTWLWKISEQWNRAEGWLIRPGGSSICSL